MALLALAASTVALGGDFSGSAGMNRSPVQQRRAATPWAAGGGAGFYLQSHLAVAIACQERSVFFIAPNVALIFKTVECVLLYKG